jgi:hypothetical protein
VPQEQALQEQAIQQQVLQQQVLQEQVRLHLIVEPGLIALMASSYQIDLRVHPSCPFQA